MMPSSIFSFQTGPLSVHDSSYIFSRPLINLYIYLMTESVTLFNRRFIFVYNHA